MDRDQKAAVVERIAERLGDADAIFAVDYRGISVPQAAELRGRLAEADATFSVVKNRLAKRALETAGASELEDFFEGPTALTFIKGDAVVAAKAIATFAREHDVLAYKGGLMDGTPLAPDQFTEIARLPGLEVLHGRLVGLTASPITGLARGLGAMLSGLAVALGQISEQGLVGGEEEQAQVPAERAEDPEEQEEGSSEEEIAEEASTDEDDAEASGQEDTEGETNPAEPDASAEDSAGDDDQED